MSKKNAITATVWSSADIFFRQGLQFSVSVVLARLLTPEEFGTIALLYLFVGIAGAFTDSGMSSALVQRQDITHSDESTVFWFNLGMGGFMALILWICSPLIAEFYQLPVLASLTSVLALNMFISALGTIHATLLTKQLNFKTPMKIGAVATTLSGGVGIFLAWQGYGVWALALQTLTSTTLTTILLWYLNKWRPIFEFKLDSARRLFGFGGYLLISGLLDTSYNQIYTLLIGKYYGAREVAFYSRAESAKQLPCGILSSVLWRVALPVFSSVKSEKKKLREGVRYALASIMLINIPIMIGMFTVSDSLILVLFGEQWSISAPVLQVLSIGGIFWPIHVINLNVLIAQGYSSLFFRLEVFKKLLGLVLILFGSAYGVMGIAWSQVLFGLISFVINTHYTKKHLDYGVLQQTMDFLPSLFLSITMGGVVIMIGNVIGTVSSINLLFQILTGAAFYIVGCQIFRIKAFVDLKKLIKLSFQ